ncbi:C-type lectin 37Db-like [Biomphalaria glabrata]|uniref:C-type lectin 37Db-like n=1 Tax=Biomphalaria glabrata TaxID=6526 RepID=A0A9W2YDT0_BIOGL|nr:C-type lectin 37Db-like [Biomphalaria glabrata]XP_055860839.1 C-type lectin 37Db-like [Biomphalaria glabrata]
MYIPAFQLLLFGTLCVVVSSDINVILDNTKVLAKGTFTNKLYYISKSAVSGFTQAKDWCAANGEGYPAEIESLEEFAFLESLVKPNSGLRVFIAGTDAQKDGTWVSQRTGTQLNVFDWSAGEPNNYSGPEECLEMMTDRAGKLNDIPCNNPLGTFNALCEKDLF